MAGKTELSVVFVKGDALLIVRKPNVHGAVPEMLVNEAYDAASVTPPRRRVFWCD